MGGEKNVRRKGRWKPMQKSMKVITVVIVAVTLVICALLVVNRLNGDIENMQAKVKDAELELRVVQNLQSDINTEIANMNKESYIIAKARELDFLMPGEMRFVVVNPEVLEDTPEEAMVEEVKEE